MKHADMISTVFPVEIKTIDEAPKYQAETKMIKGSKIIVVEEGMENKGQTIDIQCEDADGKKYLIFTTAALIESLNAICQGVKQRLAES